MDTEKLIDLVKVHDILYDLSHADYKNIRKKDAIWTRIGIHLKKDDATVKKRWGNLKDSYSRYLRSIKTRTGQANKNKKKWVWANQMSFLQPYIQFANTELNVSDIEESVSNDDDQENPGTSSALDTADSQENPGTSSALDTADSQESHRSSSTILNDSFENPILTPTSPMALDNDSNIHQTATTLNNVRFESDNPDPAVCRRNQKQLKRKTPSSTVSEMIQYLNNKKKVEHDEIDSLFLAYAKNVKKFSAKRQAIAKLKVSQVVMEQEIKNLEDLSNVAEIINYELEQTSTTQGNISDFVSSFDPNDL